MIVSESEIPEPKAVAVEETKNSLSTKKHCASVRKEMADPSKNIEDELPRRRAPYKGSGNAGNAPNRCPNKPPRSLILLSNKKG